MDLALMKSIGHCQQQNSKATPVLGNFKQLLQSLCSAVDTVRNGVAAPADVELHSNTRLDLHAAPMASEHDLLAPKGGRLLSSQGNGRTDIEASDHANVFPDAFDASNIQFEDYFGNDPNAFNMQFWPMEFARTGSAFE